MYFAKKKFKLHFDRLYLERATIICLSVFTCPQVYILPGQILVTKLAYVLCECVANRNEINMTADEFELRSANRGGVPTNPCHEPQCGRRERWNSSPALRNHLMSCHVMSCHVSLRTHRQWSLRPI